MSELVDADGTVLATVTFDPVAVVSDDPDIEAWGTAGVPALRGEIVGAEARNVPIVVSPTDDMWGLALLEEAERRGWTVRP